MFQGIVQDLIDELGMLPGVGPKSAQRIAFYVLGAESASMERLASTLTERRNGELLCVVEEPRDVFAIERLREYRGRYHVLGGAIDPIGGVGPADLRIQELQDRVSQGGVTEVILALDPNVQGEATSTYIARTLADSGVEVTRLASGLPVGGDLDYADEMTLGRAFAGRRTF